MTKQLEMPGGFSIEEAKELLNSLVNAHISKAVTRERMKSEERFTDLEIIKQSIVSAAWFVRAHIEAAEGKSHD